MTTGWWLWFKDTHFFRYRYRLCFCTLVSEWYQNWAFRSYGIAKKVFFLQHNFAKRFIFETPQITGFTCALKTTKAPSGRQRRRRSKRFTYFDLRFPLCAMSYSMKRLVSLTTTTTVYVGTERLRRAPRRKRSKINSSFNQASVQRERKIML